MSLPSQEQPSGSEAEQLITRIRRSKSRWPSEPGLRAVSPGAVTDLLDIIAYKNEEQDQNRWRMLLCFVFMLTTPQILR